MDLGRSPLDIRSSDTGQNNETERVYEGSMPVHAPHPPLANDKGLLGEHSGAAPQLVIDGIIVPLPRKDIRRIRSKRILSLG